MDVAAGSKENGAPVKQWACNGSAQQKWLLQSVESARVPTSTGLTVPAGERLNGQPGFVNAHGYVQSGAYGVGGQTVTIRYEKLEGGQWKLKTTATPTLNSEGYYEHNFMELGPGDWRMKTEYAGTSLLADSSSPDYVSFHLGSGYRFVFKHSDKCMSLAGNNGTNGTGIVQWTCSSNPSPGDGQVFTMVPNKSNSVYFHLEINSSSKCVDVTGGQTGNGVWLQEWDCNSAPQQEWDLIPVVGEWNAFQAKHSGRCMDVILGSLQNNQRVQQWDCTWVPQQQWKFQSIG